MQAGVRVCIEGIQGNRSLIFLSTLATELTLAPTCRLVLANTDHASKNEPIH